MSDILTIIMRWLHISSMATLVGGVLYGRLVLAPAVATLSPDSGNELGNKMAAAYRPLVVAAMIGSIISGLYRLMITPGHRPLYHALLGVKLLLVLHVFAVALLIVKPDNPRRTRMMTGMLVSGLVIVFISAWLSRIF
jgi:uncharacterized membrane protein